MRLGLLAASLVLVAGGAVACGDDGGSGGGDGADAPSAKEFCGALTDFRDDFADADPTKDLKAYIQTLKDAADRLENVGTPEDMPADAKDGFDLTVKKIKDLPTRRPSTTSRASVTSATRTRRSWTPSTSTSPRPVRT